MKQKQYLIAENFDLGIGSVSYKCRSIVLVCIDL